MKALLRKTVNWLLLLFHFRKDIQPDSPPTIENKNPPSPDDLPKKTNKTPVDGNNSEAPHEPPAKPKKPRKKHAAENMTQYSTIKELLDDLDALWPKLKKLTPRGGDAQRMVRKLGPYMCSFESSNDEDGVAWLAEDRKHFAPLDGYKAYGLPGYLIGFWRGDKTEQLSVPGLMCAIKNKSIGRYYLKGKSKSFYEVTEIYPVTFQRQPVELYYLMEVDNATGMINALPMPREHYASFEVRKRIKGQKSTTLGKWNGKSGITHYTYEYPDLFDIEFVKENNITVTEAAKKQLLEFRFRTLFAFVARREQSVNIIIMKDGHRVTVTVPTHRWKYFFKDRIGAKTPDGKNRPIFHAVTAHMRQTAKGEVPIRHHYRGLRDFIWGDGFRVKIVLPGLHAKAQSSFRADAVYEDDLENGRGIDIGNKGGDLLNSIFEGDSVARKSVEDAVEQVG